MYCTATSGIKGLNYPVMSSYQIIACFIDVMRELHIVEKEPLTTHELHVPYKAKHYIIFQLLRSSVCMHVHCIHVNSNCMKKKKHYKD